jgi:chromate transporter
LPLGLSDLFRYFVMLGTTGFGGPIALVGFMQRDLVERRQWYSKDEYMEGLALAQLAPGPLAAQLAIYLGWLRGGLIGATLVAFAFVLPSFIMVLVLSWLYIRFGGLPWMQGVFYGVGAAVIGMISLSAYKLLRTTLGKDRLLFAICIVCAVVTAWTETEIIWLFILCGVIALFAKAPPSRSRPTTALAISPVWVWLVTGLKGPASQALVWKVGLYFAAAGAFVFGSGLAIVPFLHGGVVKEFHWLTEQQFLDAVAVAMITPGPVVITVAFIGYLVAGPLGATSAAVGVFLPCYLFVVIPARYFRRSVKNPSVRAFVDGVTAAASGAIAGAVFVLGRRAITDVPTLLIALAALTVLLKVKKVPEPILILGAAAVGLILHGQQ